MIQIQSPAFPVETSQVKNDVKDHSHSEKPLSAWEDSINLYGPMI